MMALVLIIIVSQLTTAYAEPATSLAIPVSDRIASGDRFMGIRLLGALRLPDTKVSGFTLSGISALAWDDDENLLYALSDLGVVFHIRPIIDENNFLRDTTLIAAYPLQDAQGRPLRKPWKDSEGLFASQTRNGIRGDSELTVCFEVKQRIRRYTPTGKRLGGIALPKALQNIDRFSNANKSLEAITEHPQWGLLVAPERPLRGAVRDHLTLFSIDPERRWQYPLYPAPNSSLVAMEALPDGSLLLLERAFVSITRPLIISLRRVRLPPAPSARIVPININRIENVAVFDTSEGWLLDNFEGLTRHRQQRFFIISDDNRNFLQSTLLLYFELLPADRNTPGLPE